MKHTITLTDIQQFFTPQKQRLAVGLHLSRKEKAEGGGVHSPEWGVSPCRTSAPLVPAAKQPDLYFKRWYNKNVDMHAVTITIHGKYYGKMSYKQQYNDMVKTIKSTYSYHGETKYMFRFELQENGNLHSHGILMNTYVNKFHEAFHKYGQRNRHKLSFQPLRNIDAYIKYIDKENILPMIHNIKKKDHATLPAASGIEPSAIFKH